MTSTDIHQWLMPFEAIELSEIGRLEKYIDLPERVLLHAGPPYNSLNEVPTPVLNAACQVMMIDGAADSISQANTLIQQKVYKLQSAQLFGVVTPLAQVVSKSSWVFQTRDSINDLTAYAPLVESGPPALRFGSDTKATRMSMLGLDSLIKELQTHLFAHPIKISPLIAAGLSGGDECHAVTAATHKALMDSLSCTNVTLIKNLGFVLPLIMAASSVALQRAGAIRAIGSNGLNVGWIPADKSFWHQMRAPTPAGDLFDAEFDARVLPAIGDSAVIDFAGLGAQACDWCPQMQKLWHQHLPNIQRPERDKVIDPGTGMVGLNAIVTNSTGPSIHLAMVDKTGSGNILGRGAVVLDPELFNICATSEVWSMMPLP